MRRKNNDNRWDKWRGRRGQCKGRCSASILVSLGNYVVIDADVERCHPYIVGNADANAKRHCSASIFASTSMQISSDALHMRRCRYRCQATLLSFYIYVSIYAVAKQHRRKVLHLRRPLSLTCFLLSFSLFIHNSHLRLPTSSFVTIKNIIWILKLPSFFFIVFIL